MKTIISLYLILLFSTCAWAQAEALSPKMELFKEYCLNVRNAVAGHDLDTLEDCLKEFNQKTYMASGGDFVYRGETIALTPFSHFYPVDTLAAAPLESHLKFDPAYIDTLLATDLQPIALQSPTLLRSSSYDCMYTHQAIKAHGRCVYRSKGSGPKELFVVAENGGLVNLTVRDKKNQTETKDETPTGKPAAEVTWNMARFGEYEIEIANMSDKDISVIVVTN